MAQQILYELAGAPHWSSRARKANFAADAATRHFRRIVSHLHVNEIARLANIANLRKLCIHIARLVAREVLAVSEETKTTRRQ